jgi:hypothetical protein
LEEATFRKAFGELTQLMDRLCEATDPSNEEHHEN